MKERKQRVQDFEGFKDFRVSLVLYSPKLEKLKTLKEIVAAENEKRVIDYLRWKYSSRAAYFEIKKVEVI